MLRIIILLCLSIYTCHFVAAQSSLSSRLQKLEFRRFEAMTKKDTVFLESVLDPGLVYTHSNGLVETRSEHLRNIVTEKIRYESIEPDGVSVQTFRRSAVITGYIQVRGSYKDTSFDIRLRYLDVYIKRKGKWKLVAWQSAKIG